MWGNDDRFTKYLAEGSNHCFVIGNPSLEKYFIADPAVAYDFLQVVVHDGIGQAPHQVFIFYSFLHVGIQVGLHKYRTPVTHFHWFL